MDNSNANKGGFSPLDLISKKQSQHDTNDATSATDAANDVIVQPNMVNARTQSMIESPRDKYQQELDRAAAYQAQIQEQYRQEQARLKAKKTAVYVAFAVFGAIFLTAIVLLMIAIANNSARPVPLPNPEQQEVPTGPTGSDAIKGYHCKGSQCTLMDELPDGRILVHDTDGYYLYDVASGQATLTSIDNGEYSSIETFAWGKKILAVISPSTDKKALYSLTDNVMVTQYEYDEFFTDFNNKEVYDSTAVTPELYIIARTAMPQQYYLIDLQTGAVIVRGQEGIYTDGIFYIGYEAGGTRYVYSSGESTAFLSSVNTELYTRSGILIEVIPAASSPSIRYYGRNGQKLTVKELPFAAELNNVKNSVVAETLRNSNKYLKIPTKD